MIYMRGVLKYAFAYDIVIVLRWPCVINRVLKSKTCFALERTDNLSCKSLGCLQRPTDACVSTHTIYNTHITPPPPHLAHRHTHMNVHKCIHDWTYMPHLPPPTCTPVHFSLYWSSRDSNAMDQSSWSECTWNMSETVEIVHSKNRKILWEDVKLLSTIMFYSPAGWG